jgi:polyhydroxyalkanoate synthase
MPRACGQAGDRSFQVVSKKHDDQYLDPETFLANAPRKEGSWWPEWADWLSARSGTPVAAGAIDAARAGYTPLCDAPGTYVLQD